MQKIYGVCALAALAGVANGQYLAIPDSSNDRIMQFDPFDGSLINADFITDAGGDPFDFGTPKDVINVGNELWVSDQIEDSIYRFDLAGNFLSTITGGLDNIRGMAFANDTIYVSNSGDNNGAPGESLVMFDTDGNNMGSFPVEDPFDALEYGGNLLVSDIDNEAINRYAFDGTFLGVFHDSDGTTGIDFPQQLVARENDNVFAAGFSTPSGLYEYDPSGNQINFFDAVDGLRGIFELGNGNLLVTNGGGVWTLDPDTNTAVNVFDDASAQYIGFVVPAPSSVALLGFGAMLTRRRR